jgi:kinesin family protein 11
MITPCCGDLKELKGGHYHRIVEITENAGKCLLNEYMVRKRLSCTVSHQSVFVVYWIIILNVV